MSSSDMKNPIDDRMSHFHIKTSEDNVATDCRIETHVDYIATQSRVDTATDHDHVTQYPTETSTESIATQSRLENLTSPVTSLPARSFDVVVFCLLLEYLPSPAMRWQCCKNAFHLLKLNGLLVIVTPDSHKQHRNAGMIRSWKGAIESLGFLRWKYEKLEHIHCMAFRKVQSEIEHGLEEDSGVRGMFIHQDFLVEEEEKGGGDNSCSDEEGFRERLCEMPQIDVDSD